MIVRGLRIVSDDDGAKVDRAAWPYTMACISEILDHGLVFEKPVTFLVGENGTGKSTIIEAIAEAWGINPRGGRGKAKRHADQQRSPLGQTLELVLTERGAQFRANRKLKSRSYFLRAETAFDFNEFISSFNVILPGYWQEDLRVMSHGEGFLTILETILSEPGIYLMDEPEAALSFTSCLRLVGLMHDAGESGAQVICATHSPVLAATPGASIIEFGDNRVQHTKWADLAVVDHWQRFMAQPERYLRHIVD